MGGLNMNVSIINKLNETPKKRTRMNDAWEALSDQPNLVKQIEMLKRENAWLQQANQTLANNLNDSLEKQRQSTEELLGYHHELTQLKTRSFWQRLFN